MRCDPARRGWVGRRRRTMNWPHLTVMSIRMARIVGHEGEGLEGEVKGGEVCGDSPRSPGGWVVDPGAGRQAWCASAHGAPGAGVGDPAGAQDAAAAGATVGAVEGGDRRDVAQ